MDAGRHTDPKVRAQMLDLGGIFDAVFDILDNWVDRGIEPPPTRSDSYDLGDVNRDGINENPAIALPEIACPTGIYYNFPKGVKASGTTAFEPYLRESKHVFNATTEAFQRISMKSGSSP
jgi:hypothetical protein